MGKQEKVCYKKIVEYDGINDTHVLLVVGGFLFGFYMFWNGLIAEQVFNSVLCGVFAGLGFVIGGFVLLVVLENRKVYWVKQK